MKRPGGFAERCAVPVSTLLPFPDTVSPLQGALVEPLANGVHALSLTRQRFPETVVVIGAGTIGLMVLQVAKQDQRVGGLILLAAPGNLLEWNIRIFGRERALSVLAEAQRRVQEGRGAEVMLVDLDPLGKALYSAQHVVSLRGRGTRSDPFQNIARVKVPVLGLSQHPDPILPILGPWLESVSQ
jgi:NADPH:quinone reductase-like Zn-dependent oxidoreductase